MERIDEDRLRHQFSARSTGIAICSGKNCNGAQHFHFGHGFLTYLLRGNPSVGEEVPVLKRLGDSGRWPWLWPHEAYIQQIYRLRELFWPRASACDRQAGLISESGGARSLKLDARAPEGNL